MASSVQSTVVVTTCPNRFVLLVFRSSSSSFSESSSLIRTLSLIANSNDNNEHQEDSSYFDGIKIYKIPRDASNVLFHNWFPVGSRGVCAMTGLASDVQHVSRVFQQKVDDHYTIYDDDDSMSSGKMIAVLSRILQSAAQYQTGRPYGIQALLVSNDVPYTVDPSGCWRHWAKGCAAIGKEASEIQTRLRPCKTDLKDALGSVLRAIWHDKIAQSPEGPSENVEALVIDSQTGCISAVDPQEILECYKRLSLKEET